jgi:autotransporter translocation and assembly factor TamB
MSWRRVLRALILLLPVALGAVVAWKVHSRWPETLRGIEAEIRAAAAREGFSVSWKALRVRPLFLRVSLEGVTVADAAAGLPLLVAPHVDLSISPGRLLTGGLPVTRVRVREGLFTLSEGNLPLLRRLRSRKGGGEEGDFPEILVVSGRVRLGRLPPIEGAGAFVKELRIRKTRFLGTRITAEVEGATGRFAAAGAVVSVPPSALSADLFLDGGMARFRRLVATGAGASARLSGRLDPSGPGNDLKGSGEVALSKWISSGAPFAAALSRFATEGKVTFTASLAGSLADPEGEAKILLSGGRLIPFPSPSRSPGSPPPKTVAAAGSLSASYGKGKVTLRSARAEGWGGSASAEGTYDLRARKGSGKVLLSDLAAAELPLPRSVPAVPLGKAGITLSAEGGWDRVAYRLAAETTGGAEWRSPGAPPLLRVAGPLRVELAGSASPRERTATVERGRFLSPLLAADLRGRVDLPGRTLSAEVEGSSPAGALKDLSLPGRLAWRGFRGKGAVEGSFDDLVVRGAGSVEALLLPGLRRTVAAGRFEGTTSTAVHFAVDVPEGIARGTASGTWSPARPETGRPSVLDASVSFRDTDLAEVAAALPALLAEAGASPVSLPALAGTVAGDADLLLTGGDAAVGGTVRSARLRAAGVEVGDFEGEGKWSRRGAAAPSWNGRAGATLAGGRVAVQGASRDGATTARAEGTGLEAGRLAAAAGWEWGKANLSGRGNGRVEVAGRGGRWDVPSFHAAFPDLVVSGAPLSGFRADGSLVNRDGRATVQARNPALSLSADFRGDGEWPARLRLDAKSLPTSFVTALAGTRGERGEGTWKGEGEAQALLSRLVRGTAGWDGVPSFSFRLAGEGVSTSGFTFGRLEVDGRREGDRVRATIDSRDPAGRLEGTVGLAAPHPFRVSGPFAFGKEGGGRGEELSWSVSGKVDAKGAILEPRTTEGTLSLERIRVKAREFDLSGKDVPVHLDAGGIRLSGGTVYAEGTPLSLSGRVSWKGEVDARADGKLPAGVVRILVPGVFDRLDGVASFDLRITGNWKSPDLVGTARLEGGALSFIGYDQFFEDLKVEATLTKERLVFDRFSGRSGGGYLDGRGEVPLSASPSERMYFSVDFVDMRYPYPADFRPVVDGHVELFGPFTDFAVTGDVSVRSALYSRPLRFQKALLDVRRRLEEVSARRAKGSFNVRLDLNCVADGTLRIRNNLADATAKGEFKVVGDVYHPVVLGSFDLLDGTIDFQGVRYTVRRLTVEFNDPRRNNPRIDGAAETRKDAVTVTVLVTGTLEKYEVDFVSDPPLGKNDILSLLTLGVTTRSLAGQEGTVGASAASTLALGPYKGRVEDEIRGFVGLDRFAVEAAFSSVSRTFEPRFVVGKSFGDRLNVSVSTLVGTSSETTAIAELKLLENVFLQGAWESATTTRQGELGADLKVRYRFRRFRDVFGRDE